MRQINTPASLAYRLASQIGLDIFVCVIVPLLIHLDRPLSEALAQPPASVPGMTDNFNFFGNNIHNIAQQRLVFTDK
jgi:hypothetical protein